MSFFSNIFNGNDHASNNGSETKQAQQFHSEPDLRSFENIFVNPEPPIQENNAEPITGSGLEEFLARDYFKMGYEDGYKTHSAEAKIASINVIKSKFKMIMSRKIDQLRQELLTIENHLIDVEGIDQRLEKKILKRVEYIKERCKENEKEKVLSTESEGLVAESIHKFTDGFIKGTQMYIEEKLLATSTGMFV